MVMATLCKNCGSPVVFDPKLQKVVCSACGSAWAAEDIQSSDKELLEKNKAVSYKDVYGETTREFVDCYIYTCSSCGGEISINGSEVSTKCVYCGSTSVVFNRISKEKAPEFIIPFSISKEDAVARIRQTFSNGMFVPKEIKNFNPSDVRGIYLPYWIVNGYHSEAEIIRGSRGSGKSRHTVYCGRAGSMGITNLPVDASIMLSDESSQRLEPFDFSKFVPFDEDYLLGFYSNVSDLTNVDLYEAVNKRASQCFQKKSMETFSANNKSVTLSRSATLIHKDVFYAMLPVWFVSFDYEGKHNTLLVNGQTGKVVGGVPWNKNLFYTLTVTLTSLFALIFAFFIHHFLVSPMELANLHSRKKQSPGSLIMVFGMIALVMIAIAFAKKKKVTKQIERSQSRSIFNFMKKRQG